MTRVLWITAEVPDRTGGGGNIRQFHLLHRLAAQFDVDLLVAGEVPDPALRQRLRAVIEVEPAPPWAWPAGRWRRRLAEVTVGLPRGTPFEVLLEADTRRRLEAARPEGPYDVVVLVHPATAPFLDDRDAAVWVVELQNIGSERSAQMASVADHARHRWLWRRDARRAARLERSIGEHADLVVTCAEGDAARIAGPTLVVPNGVDADRIRPTPLPFEPRLVLTASFNYAPNVDGAAWFVDEVLPLVRAEVPAATLELVGRAPLPEVRDLTTRDGVSGAFDVPSVLPHLEAARAAVVPLRVGSGTRLKALEAMAAGRPVAGTAVGLAGLDVRDRETAVVGDDPRTLADGIVALLTDDALAGRMATDARALVEDRFGWDVVAADYADALRRLLSPTARRSAAQASAVARQE